MKFILYFVFNPYITTGISTNKIKKNISNFETMREEDDFKSFLELLDYLIKNNTGRDYDIFVVQRFINRANKKLRDFFIEVITKTLKIGVTSKTLNKIYGDNFIPEFNVMLAESYFKQKENYLNNRPFIITEKLDGMRIVLLKENNSIKFFSRQGQPIEGLIQLIADANKLPDNIVLDGELLLKNENNLNSDDLFRETLKVSRKDGEKKNLIFNAFDIMPINEFYEQKSIKTCTERKHYLESLLNSLNLEYIKNVPILYEGNDEEKIMEWLTWARDNNKEGVMVQLSDSIYECKRVKTLLKVKLMQTCDLRVIGFEEGTGSNKNSLGALIVDYKDNKCGVGSGLTLEQRQHIWKNQNGYLNKIAEIQYFEESSNKDNDNLSLRFPVFKRWRFDKDEPSYN